MANCTLCPLNLPSRPFATVLTCVVVVVLFTLVVIARSANQCKAQISTLKHISMGSANQFGSEYLHLGMIGCEDLPKWNGKDCSKYAAKAFEARGLGQQNGQATEAADEYFSSPYIKWDYFDATSEELPKFDNLRDFHGFIITGSHYSVNDDLQWMSKLGEWIRQVKQFQENNDNPPRVVATCFSHQLACKAFGGVVGKNPQGKFVWNRESIKLTKDAMDHPFFNTRYDNIDDICYSLYESHGDSVLKLPPDAKCLGESKSCEYEIVSYGDDMISIQSHPEFSEHEMVTLILPALKKSNVISESEAEKEMELFTTKPDGKAIMKLIEKYFMKMKRPLNF